MSEALQDIAAKVAGSCLPSEFQCPHCQQKIFLQQVAKIPEQQTLHLKLSSDHGQFSAMTIGKVIVEFDKLLKAVAKDVGGKVHVFLKGVERTEKDIDFEFLITSVPEKRP